MIFDLAEQSVASLLGVTQQHGSIGFVKNGVVDGGVTDAQRTLHDDDLLGQPDFQNGHASDDGIGIFLGGAVDGVVGANNKDQVGFLFNR